MISVKKSRELMNSIMTLRRAKRASFLNASLQTFVHKTLKDEQIECIHRIACHGRDVLAVLPTGLGKSAICISPFTLTHDFQKQNARGNFQHFRQSYMLSTDRIEIHQSQPASMTQRRSEGHTNGCDRWISIRSVDNTQDFRQFCLIFRRWHRRHLLWQIF